MNELINFDFSLINLWKSTAHVALSSIHLRLVVALFSLFILYKSIGAKPLFKLQILNDDIDIDIVILILVLSQSLGFFKNYLVLCTILFTSWESKHINQNDFSKKE